MQSNDRYFNELEIGWMPILDKEPISNLTKHSLYSKLCYWPHIEIIYNLKRQTLGYNYIFQLSSLYDAYRSALKTINIKYFYNCVNLHYNNLIKIKTKKINVNLLLNAFALNTDVISVIKHYHTLLFLWG